MSEQQFDFPRVEVTRMSSKVMEALLQMIQRRDLPPGSRLPPETVLASRLGTSRPTLREALSGLKALGLVESKAGQGTFVRVEADALWKWDKIIADIREREEFLDALEARRAVEGEVCSIAAQEVEREDIERITNAFERMRNVSTDPT